jgi:hypothetical protein
VLHCRPLQPLAAHRIQAGRAFPYHDPPVICRGALYTRSLDHSWNDLTVNVPLLIDAVVRQVTVLIAQLATAGGVRAPLAHIANQVFVELANELAAQGVSRKVSADMFGMALRAYVRKVRRLNESSTEHGLTLWKAVLDHLAQTPRSRDEVIAHFHRDDETQVRAVLHDLTDSGLVFASGANNATLYRAASDAELSRMRQLPAVLLLRRRSERRAGAPGVRWALHHPDHRWLSGR